MTFDSSALSGAGILAPEQVQDLVVVPLIRDSRATTVSTVVQTSRHSTRFPIVVADPTTGWVEEGHEIDVTDPTVDEIDCVPSKLAGLTVVSNELADDSDPSALQVVGDGLVRDLQVRLDAAFFGDSVANGPSGLESLEDVQHVDGGFLDNLDAFAEAISKAEQVGATTTSFVAHPATLLALSTLKVADNWNQPLLGTDPSSPTKRSIQGVPVQWSPAVDEDTIWAIPQAKVFVVIRLPASVVTDRSAFFTSDRLGIRCVLRAGFAFPREQAIIKISPDGS